MDKLELLGESAQWDICATDACLGRRGMGRKRAPGDLPKWIYPAALPDGHQVLLMKVLMSNACQNRCAYCANRCGRVGESAGFSPEELVRAFLEFHRRGLARGLFLSSAVPDSADQTMERMLKAVEMLRRKHRFRGYIHLKVLPGASFDRVERAVQLADRVSINLEAPGAERLARLAPDKDFEKALLTRMRWIRELKGREGTACRGHTTQFVVGAAGETDHEILQAGARLYGEMGLERCYFSAFAPVAGTPLGDASPTSLTREHRLYQADFLFRKYGWRLEDLRFGEDGNLTLKMDPKLAWAQAHPERFPIEVNRAELGELLRIPGVGPRSARRIIALRRRERITRLDDLRALGAAANRAAGYVLLAGRRPSEVEGQMPLDFGSAVHVGRETGPSAESARSRGYSVPV